ncbi:MAG: T9SS type A sorting domain-containing protein, partial [Bacteroidetes bacterium]
GCDSIVTLDLTILNPTSGTDVQSACGSYTWIDGNTYTNSTDTPVFTLMGSNGCDSIVTLNLTITNIDLTVNQTDSTLMAAQNGATYEWLDCQNGSVKIPGETGQSFVPQENGEYAVVITMDGCADTSACIMVTGIVGIDEILAEKEVRIYPNPNNGQFRIDFQELVPVCTIQLMTIQGSMIHTESHRNRQEVELNLQGKLAQGTYLLWISFEDGSIRKSKMVIH